MLNILATFLLSYVSFFTSVTPPGESDTTKLYAKEIIGINPGEINPDALAIALKGYGKLENEGKITNPVLTIADFSQSSNNQRLFIIDMKKKQLLLRSFVAHGKSSGEEFATKFSNVLNSGKSSLGFYLTAETYMGKHGYSLRLDGLEAFNNEARSRAIVIHGAGYVSKEFIKKYGRLGRSQGCPALPADMSEKIIELIKEKSCFFIYHPELVSRLV